MNSKIIFDHVRDKTGGTQAQYDALLRILNSGAKVEDVAKFVGISTESRPVEQRPDGAPKSKFALSKRSLDNLKGVDARLVSVVKLAIQRTPVDFLVYEGLRTKEQQAINVKNKVSKTMDSYHLTGHAVDIAPITNGTIDWSNKNGDFDKVAKAMLDCAKELGIPLTWGGHWKMVDKPHYQVNRY